MDKFYTLKGYEMINNPKMTSSMEDYLEMICRMMENQEVVRISELAERLHVQPSSASKMVSNLRDLGLVDFERYGYIRTTEKGRAVGDYLLYRHDVLNRFLCLVNKSENETEQVEKIEHFLDERTIANIERHINEVEKG